jgi:hypothetical protein
MTGTINGYKPPASQLNSFWGRHPECIPLLKVLWVEGYRVGDILVLIGAQDHVTRNGLIAKAHRLGLPPHPEAGTSRPRKLKDITEGEKAVVAYRKQSNPVVPENLNMVEYKGDDANAYSVSLFDAKYDQCRWPVGEPQELLFCGAKVVLGSKLQFCPSHYQRALSRPRQPAAAS